MSNGEQSAIFEERYQQLNDAQRAAVDHLDGPLLVLAGPGTGKTELLALRAANIIRKREVPPENLLCLTFSREGTENMRSRLTSLIGEQAAKITISTYHEFGSYIIRNFSEYFRDRELLEPTDELFTHKILSEIHDQLPYTDALRYKDTKNLKSLIRDVRMALLSPENLRQVAVANQLQIDFLTPKLREILPEKAPRTFASAQPIYQRIRDVLEQTPKAELPNNIPSLSELFLTTLDDALAEAESANKSTPLTAWKNDVFAKDKQKRTILSAQKANDRLASLANIYEQYLKVLTDNGLYDYDDMIREAVTALETHDDLKYDLQERYQYILLDEYQDTNRAQARLVELLTDSAPENRPDVMAVGDDDQAIYAFQGAQASNLRNFYEKYNGTNLISLVKNYRSSPGIIDFAKTISAKITDGAARLFGLDEKPLEAAGKNADRPATIERKYFLSPIGENQWITQRIQELLDSGTPAGQIAVLGREHSELVALAAQLNGSIPISYAKRENILTDSEPLSELLLISRLLVAIASDQTTTANALFPQVLSLKSFGLKPTDIWAASWHARDSRKPWHEAGLELDSPVKAIVERLLELALLSRTTSMEHMIDTIVRECLYEQSYELISHLTVIRRKLQTYTKRDEQIDLQNLVNFISDHREINANITNTSPYAANQDAVTLMTAHSAKGLEWDYVFVINATNERWVKTGSHGGSLLPHNLQQIHPSGDSDDDRRRLLFVTFTRARHTLYVTRATSDYDARARHSIEYFDERDEPDITDMNTPPTAEALRNDWLKDHLPPHTDQLRGYIADHTRKYRLAPTHINGFTDLAYPDDYGNYGPQKFFVGTILEFPHSMSESSVFGTCIHSVMEFLQKETLATGNIPSADSAIAHFTQKISSYHELTPNQQRQNIEHATLIIPDIITQRAELFANMSENVELEQSFARDNIIIDGVPVTGRIDRLEKDPKTKTIIVTDFKTGKKSKGNDLKGHNNETQLYFYKLLVENSPRYAGYTVTEGRIEYIDTDKVGAAQTDIVDNFEPAKLQRIKQLARAIYQHIQNDNYPDVSEYPRNLQGTIALEDYLLEHLL